MDQSLSLSSIYWEQTLQPYLDEDPSSVHQIVRRSVAVQKQGKFLPTERRDPLSVNYDFAEVSLVRVVGRHRIPVVPSSEICVFSDININSQGQRSSTMSGASMQVYRGLWNDRKVALKYMRTKAFTGEDGVITEQAVLEYRKELHNIVHEVDLMGYKPLRQHRNITNLLAVSFDCSELAPKRDSKQNEVVDAFFPPILVVELAHESFPDLRLFFDPHNNKSLPDPMPFDLAGGLIADIADGMAVLHSFSVTHADLKPENVLIFPDQGSPTGIVAKISDFGLAGCDVEYPFPSEKDRVGRRRGSETRGGTLVWLAPECLRTTDDRQHESSRDIYTFGLLATYIALRGRHPNSYAKDLTHIKLTDSMVETAVQLLEAYCSQPSVDTRLSKVAEIAQTTLRMKPEDRIQTLNGIRRLLYN
ncbi:kinase-like domain-containing protein [Trichophaea hybrida]|nr:kinase-like domain-containing protein [Trichophaea hybrida]